MSIPIEIVVKCVGRIHGFKKIKNKERFYIFNYNYSSSNGLHQTCWSNRIEAANARGIVPFGETEDSIMKDILSILVITQHQLQWHLR